MFIWEISTEKRVSLLHATLILDVCHYQELSSYLKQVGSYGLHKISASGKVTA